MRIYLPRTREMETAVEAAPLQPVTGGTETVLVVEDDAGVQATVVELLTGFGYQVLKASDAANALAIVESGMAIDPLFTDIVMPGPMCGADMAAKARALIPGLAVLYTSGYVHDATLEAGAELLAKPYTRDTLGRKVREVLDRRTHPRAAAAAVVRPAERPGLHTALCCAARTPMRATR